MLPAEWLDENGSRHWLDQFGREHVEVEASQVLHLDIDFLEAL